MANLYATWNPADKDPAVTLSNGDLTADRQGSPWKGVRCTLGKTDGLQYFEITIDDATYVMFGFGTSAYGLSSYPGSDAYSVGFMSGGGGFYVGAMFTANGKTAPTVNVGGRMNVAINHVTGKIWFGGNGTWAGGGDPAAGTDWCFSYTPGTELFPVVAMELGTCTANFGASAFTDSVPSGFDEGWYEAGAPETYEEDISSEAGINVEMEAIHLAGGLPAETGVKAEFIGSKMNDDIGPEVGVKVEFSAAGSDYSTGVDHNAGVKADFNGFGLGGSFPGAAGINAAFTRSIEVLRGVSAQAGISADFDGFNWSDFLRVYRDRIGIRYVLTLRQTDMDDLIVPISSFQTRLRTGDPTFLSVVVPGNDQYDEIAARDDSEMILTMQYVIDGTVYHSEAVCTVDLEDIRLDQGSSSESVSLSGHRTVAHAAKTVSLTGESYKAVYGGKIRYRCTPDLYLRPGDTCIIGEDTFVAGVITWMANPSYQILEIEEA